MSRIAPTHLSRLLTGWASAADAPLPRLLADSLRELAERGDVLAGTLLPSQRALAAALGVSRSTVTAAFELLEAEGRLESLRGSGSRLRSSGSVGMPAGEGRLASFGAPLAPLDLSSGALDALPDIVAAAQAAAGDLERTLSGDGYHPYGLPALREGIARSCTEAGLPTGPEHILVTAGSQQALWLIAQGLVEPGDTVLVEDPTYRGALEALRSRGARLVPLAADLHSDAIRTAVNRLAGHVRPRLVYLQPALHNPTGRTMSSSVRGAWAEVLAAHGLYAVEDGAYSELALGDDKAPRFLSSDLPLASAAAIGTFSKLFWGGLRLGWIRASTPVIHRLADIKKSVDLACPVLDQLLAVRLLDALPAARARRRNQLRGQRDEAERLLRARVPHWQWERPAGGSALWVEVPGADTEAAAQLARRHGVLVVPGPVFSAVEGFRHHLRLPYMDLEKLALALPVLASCCDRAARSS